MSSTAFNESDHPRGTGGRFAPKTHQDAGFELPPISLGQRDIYRMTNDSDPEVRKAAASHPMTPWYYLAQLARDGDPSVRLAAANNPAASQIFLRIAEDSEHEEVRQAAAAHPFWSREPLDPEVFRSEAVEFARTLTPDPMDGGACCRGFVQFAMQRLAPNESIVYGVSDDLMEVEGSISNEVDHFDADNVEFDVGGATMFATYGNRDGAWGWHFRPGRMEGSSVAFLLLDPKEEGIPEEFLYTQFWVVRSGPGDET
jgi:hypothetical protein